MQYIVYLTINLKSKSGELNKIYVGVHKTNDPNIFDGYIGCGVYINQPSTYMYPKTPFQMAVKKYGVDAFKRTTLYIFNTLEEAYKKEQELVNIDFIKQSHVYNVSLGGNYCNTYKQLYQFDLQGNLKKLWEYSIEAYEFYGYPQERFEYAIYDRHPFLDSYWSRTETINVNDYYTSKHGQPKITYLYNKDGKLLREFYSEKECAEYIGIKDLSKALKCQSLVKKQYYVSNQLFDVFIPKPRTNYLSQTYYVYDKNNKFYGKFTGKDIMPIINLHSWSSIRDIFQYNKNWYKDFYISLEEIDKVPDKHYSNGIQVDVYDKYGNFIETLKSVKDVKEKYHISASKIKNIQLGNKYVGDYIFKWHSK